MWGLLQANEDWLLADVHEKGVLFSHEDVQDVVMQVLGHPRCVSCTDSVSHAHTLVFPCYSNPLR